LAIGFLAAFCFRIPAFTAQTEQTAKTFEPLSRNLAQMRQHLSEIDDSYREISDTAAASKEQLSAVHTVLTELTENAKSESEQLSAQKQAIDELVTASQQHAQETNDVLDKVLSNILGDPIGQTFGKRATIKVFSLKEAGYRGYMAKVKLHDPGAVKLVLSHDKVGDKGETTSQAAKRTGAALAINGGGFAKSNGLIYPMGITVVDGEIKTFYRTDLSFIGLNKSGHLVGGKITSREQIKALNVMQGATFVPTLLKDGKKQVIPARWKNKKEPRTLIGHFSNGDLLLIVVDGREFGYSTGVTLEEAQDKLLEFNVRDAYTLDGGGSSTFYYNGKVLNRPSDGRERLLATNFCIYP
jgi:exopolysaccharide biosynthesis protein